MKAQRLFDIPIRPRAKPRVLMHVTDAGPGSGPGIDTVEMTCSRCGFVSEWQERLRRDAMRGVPCPQCNPQPVGV